MRCASRIPSGGAPNPRLQRTRSASPPSPQSRQPLGGRKVTSRLPRLDLASLSAILVLTVTAGLGSQGQSAPQTKTPSADTKAVLIDMPYPTSPQTPAHFRWPMTFEITVDKKGRVSKVKNVEHQRDVGPYVAAVRRARFKPAVLNGVPYKTTFVFTIDQPAMHNRAPSDAKR
jgi:hypothetical protein